MAEVLDESDAQTSTIPGLKCSYNNDQPVRKRDEMPKEPGTYYGTCTPYCAESAAASFKTREDPEMLGLDDCG
jgi:hypothetical protein